MSAKVSKHLRRQRRARKKALQQQKRQASFTEQQATGADAHAAQQAGLEAQPSPAQPEATDPDATQAVPTQSVPAHSARSQPAQAHPAVPAGPPTSAHPVARPATSRAGRAARLTALLAGCGIVITAAASAGFQIAAEDDPTEPVRVPANYVAAPLVAEHLVCPPTPGAPDSLSEAGVVEYEERDESVEASRAAMLFASSRGLVPTTTWVPITHDGPGEPASFHQGSTDSGSYAGLLADRQSATGELEDTDAPAALEIEPLTGLAIDDAPAAATGFTYHAAEGAQSGLASADCSMPERSQWFLGPETGSEAASLLTLTNPHQRDATVEVTTHSAEGQTGSLGSTTVLVPAESTRTVNMAALTDDAAQLAVHVQASGAPVAGHLQSSHASGGSGRGTDWLPGMAAPSEEHHMLGVPAGAAERPQLWIYTPGEDGGAVELQVFDADGQVTIDTPGVFSVEAGQVAVVDLEGLDTGTYEVVVSTEQPSLAAVRSAGDGQPVTVETDQAPQLDPITGEPVEPETSEEETDPTPDLSWAVSAAPAEPGFGAMVPQVGESELRFFGQGNVTYRLFDSSGEAAEDLTAAVDGPDASLVVPYEELADQAQEAGLDDLYAVVVTEAVGETRASMLTRDEAGLFTIDALKPISPAAQYVPLRFER